MAEFKKKSKYDFWYSPLALVFMLGLALFLIYSIFNLIKKEKETKFKKELALTKIESLYDRKDALAQDIKRLQTDEGIEDAIREKYQVVKKGEKVVIIIDRKVPVLEINKEKEHGFWNWIKGLFSIK